MIGLCVIIVIFASSCGCDDYIRLPGGPNVRALKERLEFYVISNTHSSGIKVDQLAQVATEIADWPQDASLKLVSTKNNNSPRDQLMIDVVLFPLKHFHLQTGYENERGGWQPSNELMDMYIKRLEVTYRALWAAYHGRLLDDGNLFMCSKFLELTNALVKGIIPTMELLQEAQLDSDSFDRKLEEMIKYEDIYNNIKLFKFLCNTYNSPIVNLLRREIIPTGLAMKPEELNSLNEKFLIKLHALGFEVSPEGELMKTIRVEPLNMAF